MKKRPAWVPDGWRVCEVEGETPPDLQPGLFGCKLAPADGKSYLGMVTRDNFTFEAVAQQLSSPLDSGVCYTFSVQLASSPEYLSYTRLTAEPANYNGPTILRLWGGFDYCDGLVLLCDSPPIAHRDWKKYRFVMRHFQAKPITHLVFQAYYPPGMRCTPSLGNLLLDDVSDIMQTDCPSDLKDTMSRELVQRLPPLESEAALDVVLIRELASVRYSDRVEIQFVLTCTENHLGFPVLFNRHLAAVANAMLQFPEKQLVIHVKNAKFKTRNLRAKYLENYLRQVGLGESQVQVWPAQKEEQEGKWKVSTQWLKATW
ncbi:MAG: hypothetical protein KIS77_18255 [Saprospiraceae bacterium]|nr:hypothetical protein [Saprospiraceae bacterium]